MLAPKHPLVSSPVSSLIIIVGCPFPVTVPLQVRRQAELRALDWLVPSSDFRLESLRCKREPIHHQSPLFAAEQQTSKYQSAHKKAIYLIIQFSSPTARL